MKLNHQRKCSWRKTKWLFAKHVYYEGKSHLHTRPTCTLSVLCSRAISFPAKYTITVVGTVHAQQSVPLDLHANALIKSNPNNIKHRWTWVGPTNVPLLRRNRMPLTASAIKPPCGPAKRTFSCLDDKTSPGQIVGEGRRRGVLGGGRLSLRIAVSVRDGLIHDAAGCGQNASWRAEMIMRVRRRENGMQDNSRNCLTSIQITEHRAWGDPPHGELTKRGVMRLKHKLQERV